MSLFFMLIVVTAAAMGVYYYWQEDARQRDATDPARSFILWALKGLAVPLLIWIFFNSGWVIDALFPKISQAKGAGKWASVFVPATIAFLFYAATWWIVVSLVWIATRVCLRTEKRIDFFASGAVWLLFATPLAFFLLLLMDLGGIGVALAICAASVVHG
ncbi:MAG TPA: hypothetical protein VK530_01385, partial [Candidatus Acidoferrum sp.]|nr:hypothetical protein [Candidatus Acidoferrum sp.]